jgi:hypothetical protein
MGDRKMQMDLGQYKSPLTLYVIWHPKYSEGKTFAKEIYAHFSRDIQKQIVYRKLGIPVFYRMDVGDTTQPLANISLDESRHTAVIILIDDEMMIDEEWREYVDAVARNFPDNGKHKLIPVAIRKNSFRISHNISAINGIRLYEETDSERKSERLIGKLTYKFCEMLQGNDQEQPKQHIKLFISHAKHDGIMIAEKIKAYVDAQTSLKTFFDTNDISCGENFGEVIKQNASTSILLAVQTDAYASREWCRKEVLIAKQHKVPAIVVHVVQKGEERSFPYLGNIPTIRWDSGTENVQEIVNLALNETLRKLYFERYFEELSKDRQKVYILSNPPELLDYIHVAQEKGTFTVLYPDPPLGHEEIEILTRVKPQSTFLTPTLLPMVEGKREEMLFRNLKVSISISEPEDMRERGIGEEHIKDAMIEFARFLLVNGATLVYGGDLRKGGFSRILFDLVKTYNADAKQPFARIENYLAWPIHVRLKKEEQSDLSHVAKFKAIDLPEDMKTHIDADKYIEPDCPENNYIWARSLTKMREEMSASVDAQILLGGRIQGFKGKYPGVIEEAYIALRNGKPIFLAGGFGGCTKAIIDALHGSRTEVFTSSFHMQRQEYKEMTELYNENTIDYDALFEFFREKGIDGLKNGLSKEENERLFYTIHIPEMISLILKGLNNIRRMKEHGA